MGSCMTEEKQRCFVSLYHPLKWIRKLGGTLKGYWGDKNLNIDTTVFCAQKEIANFFLDAIEYGSLSYTKLYTMMDYLKLNREDVLVDLGCGKGRVVCIAATQKIKKVIGVELDAKLVKCAQVNSDRMKGKTAPIEIIHGDVVNFDMQEGTIFFMFNPFGLRTMEKVVAHIKDSVLRSPRIIRIVYFGSIGLPLLHAQQWLVAEGEIADTSICVWKSKSQ